MSDEPGTDGGDAAPGSRIVVAVVDAETPGNVGTIARAMKNFGLSDLVLVDPPELDPDGEAYGFAGQAREDVLPGAETISFADLVEGYHTIACTAITNEDATSHVRYPVLTPAELPERLRGVDEQTAIVFGRERVGLTNDELARLDEICAIPASADYPSLNLGQAATIVLAELRDLTLGETQLPEARHERAPPAEVERLHDQFEDFLADIGHPTEKREKAGRLFRRLLGRADPTPREVRTLTGILRRGGLKASEESPDAAGSGEQSAHADSDEQSAAAGSGEQSAHADSDEASDGSTSDEAS